MTSRDFLCLIGDPLASCGLARETRNVLASRRCMHLQLAQPAMQSDVEAGTCPSHGRGPQHAPGLIRRSFSMRRCASSTSLNPHRPHVVPTSWLSHLLTTIVLRGHVTRTRILGCSAAPAGVTIGGCNVTVTRTTGGTPRFAPMMCEMQNPQAPSKVRANLAPHMFDADDWTHRP